MSKSRICVARSPWLLFPLALSLTNCGKPSSSGTVDAGGVDDEFTLDSEPDAATNSPPSDVPERADAGADSVDGGAGGVNSDENTDAHTASNQSSNTSTLGETSAPGGESTNSDGANSDASSSDTSTTPAGTHQGASSESVETATTATSANGSDPSASETSDPSETTEPPSPDGHAVLPDDGRSSAGKLLLEVTTANLNATPGRTNRLFISVGNYSAVDVDGVSVVFTVPEGMQFNGVGDAAPDASCWSNNCASGVQATWNIGTLGAGQTRTIEVNALVSTTAGLEEGDRIAAHVVVNAPGQSTLLVDKSLPVRLDAPEMELALTSETDPVLPGQTTVFNVDVGQIGEVPLTDAVLTLALPATMTPSGVIADGGVFEDGVVTWPLGEVGIGEAVKRTIAVHVADTAIPGNVYNPSAKLAFSTDAARTETSQLPISVIQERDPLTLKVSASQAPGGPSGTLRYFATVTNTGQRPIDGATLWFRQPDETAHNGVSAAVPDQSCWSNQCVQGVESVWSVGEILPGETRLFEVTPTVDAGIIDGRLVTNYFSLFPAEGGYTRASFSVPVNAKAEAELHLVANTLPVLPGGSYTYTAYVGQIGLAPLNHTQLTLTLPEGAQVDSISDDGVQVGNLVTWDVGTVGVAAATRRSVQVTVGDDVVPATVLEARSELFFDGGHAIDAFAEELVPVVEVLPPLTLSMQLLPEGEVSAPDMPVAVPSERLLVRTTVTNNSARAIDAVEMEFRVPSLLGFNGVSDATPDAACWSNQCVATVEAVFPLGTLSAGQSLVVDANTTVVANALSGSLIAIAPRLYAPAVTQHTIVHQVLPVSN